jgi:2,3-bisphosphoglycerate-dependent phosphoglycerate mutase
MQRLRSLRLHIFTAELFSFGVANLSSTPTRDSRVGAMLTSQLLGVQKLRRQLIISYRGSYISTRRLLLSSVRAAHQPSYTVSACMCHASHQPSCAIPACMCQASHIWSACTGRAQETVSILLEHTQQRELRVVTDWRLNERHYGLLQGSSKEDAVQRFGRDQVKLWRNSYRVAPPPMAATDQGHPANDPAYAGLPRELLPNGESLHDTLERCLPFWSEHVEPELRAGRNVLISAHGHSIRALVKAIDDISDDDIERVSLPNGMPLLYELDSQLRPIRPPPSMRAVDACGLPSPLNGYFLGGEEELSTRLARDAEVIGLDCKLPALEPADQLVPEVALPIIDEGTLDALKTFMAQDGTVYTIAVSASNTGL